MAGAIYPQHTEGDNVVRRGKVQLSALAMLGLLLKLLVLPFNPCWADQILKSHAPLTLWIAKLSQTSTSASNLLFPWLWSMLQE